MSMKFNDFVLPFGPWTNPQYGSAAAGAFGGMVGSLGQASSYQRAAEAQANASRDAARYGGAANALNSYTTLLGNTAGAASNNFGTLGGGIASLGNNRVANNAAQMNAYTGLATGAGGALSNSYGAYAGALQGLANAQSNESTGLANAYANMQGQLAQGIANAYGGYSGGLSSIAAAQAAEAGNRYNSNAMAEAARQASVGNLGSAALGAFGSAANSAFGAYGQAQAAYENARGNAAAANQAAVGGIGAANQGAIANIGTSRNNAIGNLGAAYANAGSSLGASAMAGDLDLSFTDYGYGGGGATGGFSATGPDGPIASGGFGGSGGGSGGMSLTASRRASDGSRLDGVIDKSFGGLSGLANQADSQEAYGQASAAADRAYGALQPGLDSMATGPDYSFLQDNLGGVLGGLTGLARDGYGATAAGMDQFYANQLPVSDYSGYLDRLSSGYSSALQRSGDLGGMDDVFSRSSFGGYADELGGAFARNSADLNTIAGRGLDGIDGMAYEDRDLLRGLYDGFGAASGAADRAAQAGEVAFNDTRRDLASGQTALMPDVAGDILRGIDFGGGKESVSPLRDLAKREYEQLVAAGPTSRFDPYSPNYDQSAARELSRLSQIIRSGNSLRWDA